MELFRGAAYRVPQGLAAFGIGSWDPARGNHRAVVKVVEPADAVCAYIPWRRRDAHPEAKDVLVVEAATGKPIANRVVVSCNREYGEVVFQPAGPGTYEIYYLVPVDDENAYTWPRWAFPITRYAQPRETADAGWLEQHSLRLEDRRTLPLAASPNESAPYPASWRSLPLAELVEIQARGEWHSFYPMEVCATLDERLALERRCRYRPFLVFPEDRANPIRMTQDLPYHWAVRDDEALDRFQGSAMRNEYYVLQIGVYAFRDPLTDLEVRCTDLLSDEGAVIPSSAIECFNLGGVDQNGQPFRRRLHVPRGRVQALWFGVDIPEAAQPGVYRGTVTIAAGHGGDAKGALPQQAVALQITVAPEIVADRGDSDHRRLSRLRWLNSRLAVDDELCAPFTAVEVQGRRVSVLGRVIELGPDGFPVGLESRIRMFDVVKRGRQILAAPVILEFVVQGQPAAWSFEEAQCTHQSPGKAVFTSKAMQAGLAVTVQAAVEMDGAIGYHVSVQAESEVQLDTARLTVPVRQDVARYQVYPGKALVTECPASFEDALSRFEVIWLGDFDAGLALRIADGRLSWENDGKGKLRHERADGSQTIRLETGPLRLEAGSTRDLGFELYVTPFKPLPTAHWQWRYYHAPYKEDLDVARGLQAGARVFTLHHAAARHPHISYPFLVAEGLHAVADQIHDAGGLFKLYFTIRELSTRAPELWALRSLGEEVLEHAVGGLGYEELSQLPLEYQLRDPWGHPNTGQAWMCEHLVSDYHSRWHSVFNDPSMEQDSSLQVSGASRWANFYVEGIRWLAEHAGLDGLYLDGATHDREAFKRVRKSLVRTKPKGLIDYHGNVTSIPQLPYIDSIWFGEDADYSREPSYWLVAVSGIPFGVPGELLLPKASVQRAMVYGLCQRYGWMSLEQVDPSPLWRWWDEFGIQDAWMQGYWMRECPVRVDRGDVKATAYVRTSQRTAIAVASWASEPVTVSLEIDWFAIGLEARATRVSAPKIGMFQEALSPVSLTELPIDPGKGWILVLK